MHCKWIRDDQLQCKHMKHTAVIVDDEEHCRVAISGLLQQQHPEVELIGEATNVPEGLALFRSLRPELMFLDIEMGQQTGFDLLQALGPERPHVIFTTAHEGYAIKAIRFSALDYLLKPVDPEELATAMGKVVQKQRKPQTPDQFEALMQNLTGAKSEQPQIATPMDSGLQLVKLGEVLYFSSTSEGTEVHGADGSVLTIPRVLKDIEGLMDPGHFIRSDKDHLVNVRHVRDLAKDKVKLADGTRLPVDAHQEQELRSLLAKR